MSLELNEDIRACIREYQLQMKGLEYSNEESWRLCHSSFDFNSGRRDDLEYLALQLTAYLASWGMYRGSTGIFRTNFKVHIGAVERILKQKYKELYCSAGELVANDRIFLIEELKGELAGHYSSVAYRNTEKEAIKNRITPTDTLISKILLATTGAVFAYDSNVYTILSNSERIFGLRISPYFTPDSMRQIYSCFLSNKNLETLTDIGIKYKYTTMKVLDMYLFQKGFALQK